MQGGMGSYSPAVTGADGQIRNRTNGNPTFGSIPPYQSQIPNAQGAMVDRVTGSPIGVPFGSNTANSFGDSMTMPPSGGGLVVDSNPSSFHVPAPDVSQPQGLLGTPTQATMAPGRTLVFGGSMNPDGTVSIGRQNGMGTGTGALGDYQTAGQQDGVPLGFTGTMNGRNYVNGNGWAPEYLSQDPSGQSFAFRNFLRMYLPQYASQQMPQQAPYPTKPAMNDAMNGLGRGAGPQGMVPGQAFNGAARGVGTNIANVAPGQDQAQNPLSRGLLSNPANIRNPFARY